MKIILKSFRLALRRLSLGMLIDAAAFAEKHLSAAALVVGSMAATGIFSGRWAVSQGIAAVAFVAGLVLCRRFVRQAQTDAKTLIE